MKATADSTGTMNAFEDCRVAGRTFRTLTSYLRSSDLNLCGDGVCQISESGGVCPSDCP
jgi:hypothetical protein